MFTFSSHFQFFHYYSPIIFVCVVHLLGVPNKGHVRSHSNTFYCTKSITQLELTVQDFNQPKYFLQ